MKKNVFHSAVVIVLIGVCLSLGWHHHQVRPLSSIAPSMLSVFHSEEKIVDIQVKAMSAEESKQLLGHDLLSRGVQPLQITIQNNSPNEYALNLESVDLDYIDAKEVARKIKKEALPRSIGFKVLGFLFWPFMIPGTIDSIHTFHSYKLLKRDYLAKTMKDEVVPVYSTLNRILFVPEADVKEKFTITLIGVKKFELYIFDIVTMGSPRSEAVLDPDQIETT
jgi:hypothetical protein